MNATIYPTSDIEFYKDRYKEITSIEIKSKNRKSDQDPAEIIKEFLANGVILESLSIKEASQLTYLPKELSTCPIKKLTILNCENFSSIEMLEHLPHLEYLNLSGLTLNVGKGIPFLPNLQELKLHYKSYQSDTGLLTNDLPDLHTLKLRAEEAINIGMNFPNLPKLRNLFIEAPTINTLEGLSICTNLEEIYLINLDTESLPKWFSNFKKVTWFYIEFLRKFCLLYTSPSPRDATLSRMPSSA